MDGRRLFYIALIAGGAYWLYSHRGGKTTSAPVAAPTGGASTSPAFGCIQAAERANSALHDAGMLLLKPPVDQGAWSSAESEVSSAISSAESACSGSEKSVDEARAALSVMRATLGELGGAARGGGGATDAARRQEEIDAHLDKARASLGR